MAGWGSDNKYALLGSFRSVAQLVSYEVPMVLVVVSVVMMTGSLSMTKIVENQTVPYILLMPIGFLIYLLCAAAEVGRSPFDLLEADSEIVAGYFIEYSGMKFALFFLAEYINLFAVCAGPFGACEHRPGWPGDQARPRCAVVGRDLDSGQCGAGGYHHGLPRQGSRAPHGPGAGNRGTGVATGFAVVFGKLNEAHLTQV
jgi:hypothetical protein